MKIYKEISILDFEPWYGAVQTVEELTSDELEQIGDILEGMIAEDDGWSETELNDFLWFEMDTIAEWLGYKNWEALEKAHRKHELELDDEEDEEEEN